MNSDDQKLKRLRAENEKMLAKQDKIRVDFLKTDLESCFTFASISDDEYHTCNYEAAQRILNKAETGYSTIACFFSDPKHADHIPEVERTELTAGLEQLRATLDELAMRLKLSEDA